MFFLGIAGPLLPYFLMIGVLVVFTLEAEAGVVCQSEKQNSNHHVRLSVLETKMAVPERPFYFNDRPGQIQDREVAENISPVLPGLLIPDIGNEELRCRRNIRVGPADYIGCYFGLSPPDRYVS